MKCIALTNDGRFELRRPGSESEWECYHSIRERALWDKEMLKQFGPYDRDHPEQYGEDYAAMVLIRNGIVIGTMGMQDMGYHDAAHGQSHEIEFRAIAIEPACQGQGYGGIMLMMGESAANQKGYHRAGIWADSAVVLFYARNGFTHRPADMPVRLACPIPGTIPMTKRLDLGIAQNDGSVLIAAA
ncbi:MAG: GNAT family N-acetyltransferase [Rhodospirillales bacterium]|nr:GNAT family N-acetyltransferase [Rhodospirillales bacterium]